MNPCLNGLEVQEAAEALSPTEKLAKLVGLEDSTAPYVEATSRLNTLLIRSSAIHQLVGLEDSTAPYVEATSRLDTLFIRFLAIRHRPSAAFLSEIAMVSFCNVCPTSFAFRRS